MAILLNLVKYVYFSRLCFIVSASNITRCVSSLGTSSGIANVSRLLPKQVNNFTFLLILFRLLSSYNTFMANKRLDHNVKKWQGRSVKREEDQVSRPGSM